MSEKASCLQGAFLFLNMEKRKAYQISITGRVQNVGFRFHTQDEAVKLGINGFVKNMPDGSVFIEAEGPEPQLNKFISWCHKGPSWAKVFDIKIAEQPLMGYVTFEIKR